MCPKLQQRPTQSTANKHFLSLIRNVQILASRAVQEKRPDRQITTKTQQAGLTECISRASSSSTYEWVLKYNLHNTNKTHFNLKETWKVYRRNERSKNTKCELSSVSLCWLKLCPTFFFMVIVVPHSEITTLCTSLTNEKLCEADSNRK